MSDSAFWRDLESRFRELQEEQRCDGLRTEWDDMDRRWDLRGAPNPSVQRRFELAAEHAVRRLGLQSGIKAHRHGTGAVDIWLDLLRQETNAFRSKGSSVRQIRSEVEFGIHGVIERVCQVSADYCRKLADLAEAAEQESRPGQRAVVLAETNREVVAGGAASRPQAQGQPPAVAAQADGEVLATPQRKRGRPLENEQIYRSICEQHKRHKMRMKPKQLAELPALKPVLENYSNPANIVSKALMWGRKQNLF